MKPTVKAIEGTLKFFDYKFTTKTDQDGSYITIEGKVISAICLKEMMEIDDFCIDCLTTELIITIWN